MKPDSARRKRKPSLAVAPSPPIDVTTALTVFLVLQFAIPSALRIPALGGVGYLAALWAMALGGWWCWTRIQEDILAAGPRNAVRTACCFLLCSAAISYALAMTRPIPTVELSQADLALLRLITGIGLVLAATDGILSWGRLEVLLRRLVTVGAAFAALGLLQFFTARSWVDWITLPGFIRLTDYSLLGERQGFVRATATAVHPLEFSAALSMVMPIALALALRETGRHPVRRWLPPGIIVLALVVSSSRSAYLGLIFGALVMSMRWSPIVRLKLVGAFIGLAVVIFITIPGMIGNIRGMFLFVTSDPSALSRTNSYAVVTEFVTRAPIFGRGLGTFLPIYQILDNQILLLLVDVGIAGLLMFIGLVGAAAIGPWRLSRTLDSPLQRELGTAITASLVAGTTLMLFFDSFAFPIAFGTHFLMIGLGGAYLRLLSGAAPFMSTGPGGMKL